MKTLKHYGLVMFPDECESLRCNYLFREAKKAAGYTWSRLAHEIGAAKITLLGYAQLRSFPSEEYRSRLAEVLALDVEEIFPEWMKCFVRPIEKGWDPDRPKTILNHKLARKIAENIPADPEDSPEEYAAQNELMEAFRRIFKTISYREREILKLRYGMGKLRGISLSLEETGEYFKLSRERVRQLEVSGLQRLQRPERKNRFGGFLSPYEPQRQQRHLRDSIGKMLKSLSPKERGVLESYYSGYPVREGMDLVARIFYLSMEL